MRASCRTTIVPVMGQPDGPSAPSAAAQGGPSSEPAVLGLCVPEALAALSQLTAAGPPAAPAFPGPSVGTRPIPQAQLPHIPPPLLPWQRNPQAPAWGSHNAPPQLPWLARATALPLPAVPAVGIPGTGAHAGRIALPSDLLDAEPVYVNAKQYHCILRRREQRAKAAAQNRMLTVRKPFLHRSRHEHAARRVRHASGRFLTAAEKRAAAAAAAGSPESAAADSGCGSPVPAVSQQQLGDGDGASGRAEAVASPPGA